MNLVDIIFLAVALSIDAGIVSFSQGIIFVEVDQSIKTSGKFTILTLVGNLKRSDILQPFNCNLLSEFFCIVKLDRLLNAGIKNISQIDNKKRKNDKCKNLFHLLIIMFSLFAFILQK